MQRARSCCTMSGAIPSYSNSAFDTTPWGGDERSGGEFRIDTPYRVTIPSNEMILDLGSAGCRRKGRRRRRVPVGSVEDERPPREGAAIPPDPGLENATNYNRIRIVGAATQVEPNPPRCLAYPTR